MHRTRNAAYGQPYRGFKSLPLRQHPSLTFEIIEMCAPTIPRAPTFAPLIVRSCRGSHLKANSIVNWFAALYAELGFEGCSSHSGRRSFITVAARNIHKADCSLRDVQFLARRRSIETTERYIDGDTCAQRKLVGLV